MLKKKILSQKALKYPLFVMGGLLVLSLILTIFLGIEVSFRVVFGSFYILVLPGLALTYGGFGFRQIDMIERIVLSFALSISVVPLLVFYLNRLGIKINFLNVLWEVALIVAAGLAIVYWRYWRKKK